MADILERKKYITHLPDFLKQFLEFQEIGKAVDKTVNTFDNAMEKVLSNAFIEDCDEYGIQRYENMMEISPSADDTLEFRKAVVLARWNNKLPYTVRVLRERLNTLCGKHNYMLDTGKTDEYYLACMLYDENFVEQVSKLFDNILPANIYYEIFYTASNQAAAYFKANVIDCEVMVVKEA